MRIVKIAAAIAVSLPLIGVMGCCEQNPCNTGCDYVASAAPCDCTTFPTQGRTWTPRTQPGLNGVAIRPASVEYEVEPMYYRLGADVSANSSAVRMGTVPGRRIARRSESQPKYITPFATRRRGVVETTDFAPAVAVVPATPAAQAVAVAPVTVGSAVPAIPVAAIPVQSAAGGVCAPGDNLSECFTLPETAAASGDLELVVPTADVAMAASSSAAAAPTEELVIPDVPVIDAPIASRQELETASTLEAPITVSDLAEPTTLPPAIDASQVQTSRQLAEVVTDPEPLAPPAELLTDAADRAEAETAAPASVADAADTLPAEAVASASLSAESADDTASITTGPLVDMPVELIPPLPDTQISTMAASGQAASAPQIAEINEVADVIRSRYGDAPESVHKVELPPSLD